jgi:hypothetical protein
MDKQCFKTGQYKVLLKIQSDDCQINTDVVFFWLTKSRHDNSYTYKAMIK